jgi:hypothetical protein
MLYSASLIKTTFQDERRMMNDQRLVVRHWSSVVRQICLRRVKDA